MNEIRIPASDHIEGSHEIKIQDQVYSVVQDKDGTLYLADAKGNIFPQQTDISIRQSMRDCPRVTVTLLIKTIPDDKKKE